ncbi:MAG: polysulfide reductase NrfD, partial [Candidatus Aminicenantes bacterium]|nr:polysulfide reductase NrfD [Candidatus Aminicenantes bacterium]
AFGLNIAIYFYLTGLSAGSFILSTLAYGFGLKIFKPVGRIGVVLATALLIIAPIFLLLHLGSPLRFWHLFVYLNFASPITWGTFLLVIYPINCIIYGYFMFRNKPKQTRLFAFIGIPLAILVHGYTGFIVAVGKARALWNTALMPILFLVSAIVSGIALMIIAYLVVTGIFSKNRKPDFSLVEKLAKILAWTIVLDLFLVVSDLIVLAFSHTDAQETLQVLLKGKFFIPFVVIENLLGKILPFFLLVIPRFRNLVTITLASILVIIGIFFMRYVVILGGEFIPLI